MTDADLSSRSIAREPCMTGDWGISDEDEWGLEEWQPTRFLHECTNCGIETEMVNDNGHCQGCAS